jgi:hypothetical protein
VSPWTDDANVGQYWEVQEGQKRQRKSLEHFKVEVAKTKELEVKTGAGVLGREGRGPVTMDAHLFRLESHLLAARLSALSV